MSNSKAKNKNYILNHRYNESSSIIPILDRKSDLGNDLTKYLQNMNIGFQTTNDVNIFMSGTGWFSY